LVEVLVGYKAFALEAAGAAAKGVVVAGLSELRLAVVHGKVQPVV